MHQWSLLELQGATAQSRASTPRTTQDRGSLWSSRVRRESGCCCCGPRGAPFWVWLLLGALVVPGARSFLSEEQEELLVELHNHYRGQVSPSASAMLPLKWDSSLKLIAERYATKCVWNHNPELEDTGENLFAGTGALDLRVALEKWFLEHLDYDFQNNSCDEDKMCGHYTQMVWADTHRVGCAFHLCNTMEGLDWERVSFLVCNYYPAGNFEGERPFVEGDWCSRCPENLQKCENNLCAPDAEEDDGDDDGDDDDDDDHVTTDPSTLPDDITPPPIDAPLLPDETVIFPLKDDEVSLPPATSAETSPPPATTSVRPGGEEDEEEEEKEVEEVEEEQEEERKAAAEKETVEQKIHQSKVTFSAGSVGSPSVLLACLTGILTLWL
ncbi:peptidase inhibitor 16-like [Parambassis ranga]|uniref:Peptidase inhibitor 16 n=1 Tax=Parambassis ranga TaxID=210632 RepID=A0A6P7IWI2_9TELE|nr:peptidase inhibitor 16-like [Parambassis ranga]